MGKSKNFREPLRKYIQSLEQMLPGIPSDRKGKLEKVSEFIVFRLKQGEQACLVFICTHNSRRSHFGQIWGHILSRWFDLDLVETYSGGTEATAFNPNAVKAMEEAGVLVEKTSQEANPVYHLFFAEDQRPVEAFSKKYDDPVNPEADFCAVMTCSDADENCPFIPGASMRIPLTYEDPKKSDGTSLQEAIYRERCRQIAGEMYYLFKSVKGRLEII